MPQSTAKPKAAKPVRGKDFPKDSPLTAHNNGRFCKKVNGRLHYFGYWADHAAAVGEWLDQKDDILAGRDPKASRPVEGLTIGDVGAKKGLCNHFLTAKWEAVGAGELSPRSWQDYRATCERVQRVFGKTALVSTLTPDDFLRLRKDMAKTLGPVSIGNEITRTRILFNWALGDDDRDPLIEKPIKFGSLFKRPSDKVLRIHKEAQRRKHGARMFEADELRAVIKAANVQFKAMILLAVNAGFGNHDLGTLPLDALDLTRGWVEFMRPKTGEPRRCPLWPETVSAIRDAIARRPTPKNEADDELVFITKRGLCWSKTRNCGATTNDGKPDVEGSRDNPVSKEMAKLLKELGLKRPRLNFYCLRHTFQTIGEEGGDQVATRSIMGHAPHTRDMGAWYRERIADERLLRVVNHVRNWLLTADRGDEKEPEGGWTLC